MVQSRDLTSPFGSTQGYYLSRSLAESHTVHVVCRRRPSGRDDPGGPDGLVFHVLDTGEVPVVSGALFILLSTAYAAVLALLTGFDAVYSYKSELPQGWLASRLGRGRFVVSLQAVPVRQADDLTAESGTDESIGARIAAAVRRGYGAVTGWLLADADAVVCLTEGIKRITERQYGIDLSDAAVVPMGVDTDRFSMEAPARAERDPDAPWRLLYVGTVHLTRGLDSVFEVVAESAFDLELHVVGSGPESHVRALRSRVRELGIEDRVVWHGFVAHEEVPGLLTETDVALSPLSDIESYRISFPAKLLEYLAAGCLVVATDIDPHRRLIEDGENGYLHAPGSEGLQEGLSRCLADADRHAAVRQAARATALQYDWDAVTAEHERVLWPADGGSTERRQPRRVSTSE
ncbi:glycosyltransferase family 4 protein [Halomicroarcula sp. GCM10025709]|uniref:glycosyltransferase family 4 protein n=1 Tax=Haloarcula TaxID=2237 RepID=UPI0024C36248|nr:glycosyltransferase family 4 protein [Halomicroarcula sp. YJ-61-S]